MKGCDDERARALQEVLASCLHAPLWRVHEVLCLFLESIHYSDNRNTEREALPIFEAYDHREDAGSGEEKKKIMINYDMCLPKFQCIHRSSVVEKKGPTDSRSSHTRSTTNRF
jgi:hypothetical protein